MAFSREALEQIQCEYRTIPEKQLRLVEGYVLRNFNNARAKEHATQGFPRRLKILSRCIERIFEILPPDRTELPTTEQLTDAVINIQAFIFHVFGSMDNLAWIWVCEKGLKRPDGSPLPDQWIGLKKAMVRNSFSQEFQQYLETLREWFEHLENFRHALAHRIPPYIPPYTVHPDNEAAYRDLEHRMEAAVQSRDFAAYERLSDEQNALAVFTPLMTHSFEEKSKTVVFHAQVLADFNTIELLGKKVLEELDRK